MEFAALGYERSIAPAPEPRLAAQLEVELQSKLHATTATCASDNSERGLRRIRIKVRCVRIRIVKLRVVGQPERLAADFQVVTLAVSQHLDERSIQVEETWTGDRVPSHVAKHSRSSNRSVSRGVEPRTADV